jgi:Tfp pilus assembly protein PilO
VRARVASLSPRATSALAIVAVIVYAIAVWFLLVAPKRSETSRLGEDLASAEIRLVEAQAAATRPGQAGVPVSDVFRLAKAMPSSDDQPGLVLELSRLAKASGVTLRAISPQPPVTGAGGATMIPVSLTIGGSYFQIAKFLRRTRALVTVRDGRLRATGRLLTVQNVQLVESATEGFPTLDATVNLNSYVYDGPIVPAGTPAEPSEELSPSGGATAVGSTR